MASQPASPCCKRMRSPILIAGVLYFLFAVVALFTYSKFGNSNTFRNLAKAMSFKRLLRRMRGSRQRVRTGQPMQLEEYPGAWGWNETESAEAKKYEGMAMITLATGDTAARHAVVLLQTLRDSGTKIPVLEVLLSRGGAGSEDCNNAALRNARNRHYHCSSKHVVSDDIVSQKYLDAFHRLGAVVRVIDPIPDTPYTRIPGGRSHFWGMSFNKMRIFGYTEYKKILFIDADVLVLRNLDAVLQEPGFTAAFTTECCNRGARAKLGGGMWIFEPSAELWNRTQELIAQPCPVSLCGMEDGTWVHSDMDVVNHLFCEIDETKQYRNWPFVRDFRQGVVPGLQYYPAYRDHDIAQLTAFPSSGLPAPEGLMPEFKDEKKMIWRMLDARFDGLVGTCECMGERDMPDVGITVHFSCMNTMPKPGHINSDAEMLGNIYTKALSCTRHYFLLWYDAYVRGMGGERLGPPMYAGPPVPGHNKSHDAMVERWRMEAKADEERREAAKKTAEDAQK